MPTPSNIPFTRGQNVVLKLYQNGKPVYIKTKSFKIEENATEVADPVNGEDRDRLDKVTNYFSFSCDVYESDAELINAILEAQAEDDLQGLPLSQFAAVQKKMRDGTRLSYLMLEAKFGPFDYNPGERSGAAMYNFKGRFRYFKKTTSA